MIFSRWTATVVYRSDHGIVDVIHDLEELSDLHDLVECGPDWDTIEQITIRRADGEKLMLEQANHQ